MFRKKTKYSFTSLLGLRPKVKQPNKKGDITTACLRIKVPVVKDVMLDAKLLQKID